MLLLTFAHSFFLRKAARPKSLYQFRQIFRCAKQHVHIRQNIILLVHIVAYEPQG